MNEPKYSLDKAFEMMAKRCSVAEKCRKDIFDKLMQWGFSKSESESIVTRLEKERYISDERFAVSYTRDKRRFNKW